MDALQIALAGMGVLVAIAGIVLLFGVTKLGNSKVGIRKNAKLGKILIIIGIILVALGLIVVPVVVPAPEVVWKASQSHIFGAVDTSAAKVLQIVSPATFI